MRDPATATSTATVHVPLIALALLLAALGCRGPAEMPPAPEPGSQPIPWALAIHGGAGSFADLSPEREAAVRGGIEQALREGARMLDEGALAVDVVETIVRRLEDDPEFNAGRGAVFDAEGVHRLDASIMDGRSAACGAVTGVRTVRHPITLARRVMERTRHVLLAGDGAEGFADEQGVERVDNEWFSTAGRREAWQRWREATRAGEGGGTVGAVARDRQGNLAAATSTGGLTGKMAGRVGDSPIVGAGTWADNRTVAVSCTGNGEEFIRNAVAHRIADEIELGGRTVEAALDAVLVGRLRPGDGGAIAVDAAGHVALRYTTAAMARGAADAGGRMEVAIGED